MKSSELIDDEQPFVPRFDEQEPWCTTVGRDRRNLMRSNSDGAEQRCEGHTSIVVQCNRVGKSEIVVPREQRGCKKHQSNWNACSFRRILPRLKEHRNCYDEEQHQSDKQRSDRPPLDVEFESLRSRLGGTHDFQPKPTESLGPSRSPDPPQYTSSRARIGRVGVSTRGPG